eukprot:1063331-Pleurochrysis_carterae.AAC.2
MTSGPGECWPLQLLRFSQAFDMEIDRWRPETSIPLCCGAVLTVCCAWYGKVWMPIPRSLLLRADAPIGHPA